MNDILCQGCGGVTNTATSNFWVSSGKPTECYVRFVDGKPEKGCGFEAVSDRKKEMYGKIIAADLPALK